MINHSAPLLFLLPGNLIFQRKAPVMGAVRSKQLYLLEAPSNSSNGHIDNLKKQTIP